MNSGIPKKMRGSRAQGGFTIVEIVVVIVLMLAVIIPVAAVIASALETSTEEQRLAHCAFLAQMKVEKARAASNCYTDAGAGCPQTAGNSDFSNDFSENAAACSFPVPFEEYECTIDDTMVAWSANRFKTIQVRVWFDENSNGTRDDNEPQVYLETMLTTRPPS